MTLNELADAVERSEGPSRELDAEICVALGVEPQAREMLQFPAYDRCIGYYTASLDAAKGLIKGPPEYPNSKCYLIDCAAQTSVHSSPVAYVWNDAGKHMGKGRTDALALCAAALRALAQRGVSRDD